MGTIPLDPARGGLCLAPSALRVADIVVSTTSAASSSLIRGVTGSEVSHAMVYVGDGFVVEAISKGVTRRTVGESLADAKLAVAYGRKHITPDAAKVVADYVRAQVGKSYDFGGAAGSGLTANAFVCVIVLGVVPCTAATKAARSGRLSSEDRFFCSELVLDAFRHAGFPLTSQQPTLSTPQSIVEAYSRGVLEYVGHLKP